MIVRQLTELNVVGIGASVSTFEIDEHEMTAAACGYEELMESVLVPLAAANLGLRASVYGHCGAGVNFRRADCANFFSVAGDRRVFDALFALFRGIEGLSVLSCNHVHPMPGSPQYHLEDGMYWRQEDAGVWYAVEHGSKGSGERLAGEGQETLPRNEPGREDDSPDGRVGPGANTTAANSSYTEEPLRFQAARSDASIGSIARSIEAVFGLPDGSVALRGPDRKVLRPDATIRTLRRRWK